MGGLFNTNSATLSKNIVNGNFENVEGIEKALGVINFRDLLAHGLLTNHSIMRGFGERVSLTVVTTGNDLWNGATVVCPIPATMGEQLSIVSTGAQDSVGGTGINSIDVTYVDSTGIERHEIVAMNGTFPVNMVAANVRFVQNIHTESCGAVGAAVGTITIYKTGSPATVYNQIDIGTNMSVNSSRMVPANKTLYLNSMTICAAGADELSVKLRSTSTDEDVLTNFFLFKNTYALRDSAITKNFDVPIKFPALSIVKATAYSRTAGSRASLEWSGWIE